MKDKEFLIWFWERLLEEYREDPKSDYMLKLTAIIHAIQEEKETPNCPKAEIEST